MKDYVPGSIRGILTSVDLFKNGPEVRYAMTDSPKREDQKTSLEQLVKQTTTDFEHMHEAESLFEALPGLTFLPIIGLIGYIDLGIFGNKPPSALEGLIGNPGIVLGEFIVGTFLLTHVAPYLLAQRGQKMARTYWSKYEQELSDLRDYK